MGLEEWCSTDPGLKTFSTLSPLPRFWKRYLRPILAGGRTSGTLSRDEIAAMFSDKAVAALRKTHIAHRSPAPRHPADLMLSILDDSRWIESPSYRKWLRKPLVEFAHHYLRKELDSHGRPPLPSKRARSGD